MKTLQYLYIFFITIFLLLGIMSSNCLSPGATTSIPSPPTEKQRGAHIFGRVDSTNLARLHQNNVEWVTLVPWGFQEDVDSPEVSHHDGDSLNIMYHDSSWTHQIQEFRSAGFKVFYKPHLWLGSPPEGMWRSDIYPTNEENWATWSETYRNFILRYAKVAERGQAEMFCVGTEFTRLSADKPDFWRKLIQDVRAVYSGKLTYAANWYMEYEQVPFWDDLDYIGIQAYFPLTDHVCPEVSQIVTGWGKHLPTIKSVYECYDRPVLFTEMGYKSTIDSAIEPWVWVDYGLDQSHDYSLETQVNCYQAFFDTVWTQDWFVGVHLWQFRGDFKERNGKVNIDFNPQGKPAEGVITRGFERISQ